MYYGCCVCVCGGDSLAPRSVPVLILSCLSIVSMVWPGPLSCLRWLFNLLNALTAWLTIFIILRSIPLLFGCPVFLDFHKLISFSLRKLPCLAQGYRMGKIIIKYSFLLKLSSQIIVILFSLEDLDNCKVIMELTAEQRKEKKCRRTQKGSSYFLYCYFFPIPLRIQSLWTNERAQKSKQNKK